MREAVGMDFGLMLECHTRYDTESAIQIAKAVEPFRPMWLEEPVPSDNPGRDGEGPLDDARSDCGGREPLHPVRFPAVPGKTGAQHHPTGYGESRRASRIPEIAPLAEIYHVPIAPHGVASTLGKVAFAHVCATVPNFLILEWAHIESKLHDSLTTAAN